MSASPSASSPPRCLVVVARPRLALLSRQTSRSRHRLPCVWRHFISSFRALHLRHAASDPELVRAARPRGPCGVRGWLGLHSRVCTCRMRFAPTGPLRWHHCHESAACSHLVLDRTRSCILLSTRALTDRVSKILTPRRVLASCVRVALAHFDEISVVRRPILSGHS